MATKVDVTEYIRKRCQVEGELRESLATIAEHTGVSIATAHRAIKALEKGHVIKVIPSKLRTEPNKIYYLGDPTKEAPALSKLPEKGNKYASLLKELSYHLKQKQDTIDELREQLHQYEGEDTFKKIDLPNGMEVVVRYKARGKV